MTIETACRFTLCTLNHNQIIRIEHADDLDAFLPAINAGGAFALVDRDPAATGEELPVLSGRIIARFSQAAPVRVTTGRAPGVGRGGNGQFRTNYATRALVTPLDRAGLDAVIARCQAQLQEVA
jgi:hypothetical protein